MNGLLSRAAARLVRLTRLVDRGYQRFDQLRSLLVLAFATPRFHDTYSRLSYGATSAYRADADDFRTGLFEWEERAIAEWFPPPPARLLIGGAGGGREAFALLARGYEVVAFDPACALAESMRRRATEAGMTALRAYCAGYEDLPIMRAGPGSRAADLRSEPPFGAAILGWSSFSHLSSDEARASALIQVAAVTRGPILVSYFQRQGPSPQHPGSRLLRGLRRRAAQRGDAAFSVGLGYTRLLSEEEVRALVNRAGLRIAFIDRHSTWPNAVLVSRDDTANVSS